MFWLITGIIVGVVFFIASFFIAARNKRNFNNENFLLTLSTWLTRGLAGLIVFGGFLFSSVYFVNAKHVGVVDKKWGGGSLEGSRIVATDGSNGIQAETLRDGLHIGMFRWKYDIEQYPVFVVAQDQVGIIQTKDGAAMPSGMVFAPEWSADEFNKMLDAQYFLTGANGPKGFKGPQLSILGPGEYPINPALYTVTGVPVVVVNQGTVGVVKANVAGIPGGLKSIYAQSHAPENPLQGTVNPGDIGVWSVALPPGRYWLHPQAYQVTVIDVTRQQMDFLGEGKSDGAETAKIRVKARDGISFDVDSTAIYHVDPVNAPVIVAQIGNHEKIAGLVNTQVRQIMRDRVGEQVTLTFVNDRVKEQVAMTQAIAEAMEQFYVTVDDISIRNISGDQLAALLATQSDREIAKQRQVTFAEQQAAAEKEKELNKAKQAAVEETSLATANYEAKREEERKKQAITKAEAAAQERTIAAKAEADAIEIRAKAEANAIGLKGDAEAKRYAQIVAALGSQNATAIEVIDRVRGEIGKVKLPQFLIFGGGNGNAGLGEGIMAKLLQSMTPTVNEPQEEPAASGASDPAKPPIKKTSKSGLESKKL